MNKTIFFQSSLPRAGSTLFQNIMAQNPLIYSTSTSGLYSLVEGNINSFVSNIDFKKEKNYNLCKEAFYNYCKEGVNGYYSFLTPKPLILDKSRNWILMLPLLSKLYKNLKVITLIRDLRSIFSSFENQYLKNPEFKYHIQNELNIYNLTFLDRIEYYENLPMIVDSLKIIQDIINFKNPHNIHFTKFEDLCNNSTSFLKNIYNYLDIDYFYHDLNNINQVTYENDNFHILGDHTISPSLFSPKQNFTQILTPQVSNYIFDKYNWFFTYFNYKQ